MLAYKYSEETKEYLGTQEAQPNPLEGGYLLPANSTFEEPPMVENEQIQVFENESWVVRTDHRKHWQIKLSDKTASIVDYIGDQKQGFQFISDNVYTDFISDTEKYAVIDGVFKNIEDTEEYLNIVKGRKYAENDTKAEVARTSKTFTLTLQDKECSFNTKAQTQADLLTAFAVCSQGGTYDGWVCDNGTVIDLTLSDVATISATFKELSNVYPHWNYYKSLIDNATTKEEVDAIVIDYESEVV